MVGKPLSNLELLSPDKERTTGFVDTRVETCHGIQTHSQQRSAGSRHETTFLNDGKVATTLLLIASGSLDDDGNTSSRRCAELIQMWYPAAAYTPKIIM
jgi:hypothetical protein